MKNYEMTFAYKVGQEKAMDAKVESLFKENGVNVKKRDELGEKFLAYEVKKQNKGFYVYYEAEAEPTVLAKLENSVMLLPDIIRHLFIQRG